ncbi:hypothetical protein BAUCODRAFT_103440 [Baudoinia panamericana UAMH 10762]|uniref:5'-3' DNA helicase ZGRF1-like N-terminal domain-containing protein n=1 Tax=Baudoinia panamericana (strain UAMH 10762) TaxID=717646 RepID=M2NHQ0_BAUPA|nr:uncharacterized protein BAUCODRAFT_103440 [Baudoinia panamericana UAMH 10762]EMC98884.1 hypothetical protein BAUCODRAFT_103440 [Baudoinia panamericana UAMH 10762]
MTAAGYRNGTPFLSVPHTQNTAPVLEYRCMYTQEVRRKHKRYKDGFLRYHTFNKRVMVYDDKHNFLGDSHWTANAALQEGDEVNLERDGAIVEVGELMHMSETDLSDLIKSKRKGNSDPASSPTPRTPFAKTIIETAARSSVQAKHRSLNALLGGTSGTTGKAALPVKSPYELHQAAAGSEPWEDGRSAKRQRTGAAHGGSIACTKKLSKEEPPWARTSDAAKQRTKAPLQEGQQRMKTHGTVDVHNDEPTSVGFLPGFPSDALAPLTSSPKRPTPNKQPIPVRSSSPAFQTQRLSPKYSVNPGDAHARKATSLVENRCVADDRHKQPKDLSNQRLGAGKDLVRAHRDPKCTTPPVASNVGESTNPATVQIATGLPKKRQLLCQAQLNAYDSQAPSAKLGEDRGRLVNAGRTAVPEKSKVPKTQRELLKERLAKLDGRKLQPTLDDADADIEGVRRQNAAQSAKEVHHDAADGVTCPEKPNQPEARKTSLAELDQTRLHVSPGKADDGRCVTIAPPARNDVASLPARDDGVFQRAQSDNITMSKPWRTSAAPMRLTLSPSKRAAQAGTISEIAPVATPRPLALVKASKKPLHRTVSLKTMPEGSTAVLLSRPFQAPIRAGESGGEMQAAVAVKPDPWSREAFDLFTWRPPNWDEERWCFKDSPDTAVVTAQKINEA